MKDNYLDEHERKYLLLPLVPDEFRTTLGFSLRLITSTWETQTK